MMFMLRPIHLVLLFVFLC